MGKNILILFSLVFIIASCATSTQTANLADVAGDVATLAGSVASGSAPLGGSQPGSRIGHQIALEGVVVCNANSFF
ncbi:MAG: hypothetical protein ACLGGX_02045 [Bdellovibrionia bacterium]